MAHITIKGITYKLTPKVERECKSVAELIAHFTGKQSNITLNQ